MDRIDAMQVFVSVVESGSFTAAADRLGISKALASKQIAGLEKRLGARLLNRTTRSLALTEIGRSYLAACQNLLGEFEAMEALVQESHAKVRGLLRLSAPTSFGESHLGAVVAAMLAQYPELQIELKLTDRVVDLIEEGFDAAIRIGELEDSTLIARRVAEIRTLLCAAPGYLERAGRPTHPRDLAAHQCLLDLNYKTGPNWAFTIDGRRQFVHVDGRLRVNSAVTVREGLFALGGIARLPSFVVADDIAAGRLEIVLSDFEVEPFGIFLVYPHARHLAAKVRVFGALLAAHARSDPHWQGFNPSQG
ncbi:MAG: LysR family transcriptional regulator [Rhodobiaceae bacterium]|nr:LysR family transcriptional regulator [Rhodobiaceae bacterium]